MSTVDPHHFPAKAPNTPAKRSFSPEVLAEIEALAARYPDRTAILLPCLRLLEREFGTVDEPGMQLVAEVVGVSAAKVQGIHSFYTHFRRSHDGRYVFQVCSTFSCALGGSEKVFDHLAGELGIGKDGTTPDGLFSLKKVECLANCDQAPCLQVNEDFVDRVTPVRASELVREIRTFHGSGRDTGPVGLFHPPPQKYHLPKNPFEPRLLKGALEEGSETFAVYRRNGGYDTAKALLQSGRNPDEVVEQVFQAGLRGRGGAGFPTGQKWKFLAKNNKPRYLVINADESEPGTFKDKLLMERNPHLLIEGIVCAAYAIKAKAAYIYIRGELPLGARILNQAIAEAYANGVLGPDAFGTGTQIDITVHRGGGAYICGEETGLLSSLEGGRGHPRIKPPFPAVEGAWGCPTIVNNVETIMCVPGILQHGSQWFREKGTEKSPGTKIFSVSGHIARPGNYELPLGVPLKEFLFDICGGIPNGRKLKAVCPGGSSAPFLTAEEVLRTDKPITLDFDSLAANGSMLGSGAIVVMDETTNMVDVLWNILRFYAHESCGQCTPCREGTGWIAKMAGRMYSGGAKKSDIDMLDEVAWAMVGRTICVLADAAAMPARSIVRKFRPEFEAWIAAHPDRPQRPAGHGHGKGHGSAHA